MYPCPLCKSKLDHTRNRGIARFFCESCGFSEKGEPGLTTSEVYYLISKKFKNRSSTPRQGLTKKKRRFNTKKSSKLTNDPKITGNSEKVIRDLAKKGDKIPKVLQAMVNDRSFQTVYSEKYQPRLPDTAGPLEDYILVHAIREHLRKRGIKELFQFQVDAKRLIQDGKNVLISAPTGMGKTEAFLIPIIENLFLQAPFTGNRKRPGALFIYPTKALARDQESKIRAYCEVMSLRVAVFDGDTPKNRRSAIYSNPPDILITNPDMIHYHLRKNYSFRGMLASVKYLVIDEIHLCIGSFGSNILWLLRRMKRFQPDMQMIGVSATIENAQGFSEVLFDSKVELVEVKNVRRAPLYLSMIYPKESSSLSTMAKVIQYMVAAKSKTLAFANSHLTTESLNLILGNNNVKSEIHRAGLSKSHRDKVESLFRSDRLDVLVSTPTLELGIDIGHLDSVVTALTGLTSFLQRIGRAGRKGQQSFATLVFRGDDPISAYYARYPERYIKEVDPAYVEPNNELVARNQLLSMIQEKPLGDSEYAKYKRFVDPLIDERILLHDFENIVVKDSRMVDKFLQEFSIRGIGESVSIEINGKKLGERSYPMALSELHPGAMYLHGGHPYQVKKFDQRFNKAEIKSFTNSGLKTQAERTIFPRVTEVDFEREILGWGTAYVTLDLTESVSGYFVKDIFTDEIREHHTLDEELTYHFQTKGFVFQAPIPEKQLENLATTDMDEVLMGTYHAIEHVLIESGNSFTGGGANQIGGISLGDSGTIVVYDGAPGGSGLSKLLYDNLSKGLRRSLKILEECPCRRRDGCPRCTYSYQCGNNNSPLDRLGAINSLSLMSKSSTTINLDWEHEDPLI